MNAAPMFEVAESAIDKRIDKLKEIKRQVKQHALAANLFELDKKPTPDDFNEDNMVKPLIHVINRFHVGGTVVSRRIGKRRTFQILKDEKYSKFRYIIDIR